MIFIEEGVERVERNESEEISNLRGVMESLRMGLDLKKTNFELTTFLINTVKSKNFWCLKTMNSCIKYNLELKFLLRIIFVNFFF